MIDLHRAFNKHNLSIANSFIEDDTPTIAMFNDPNDEVFLQPLKL